MPRSQVRGYPAFGHTNSSDSESNEVYRLAYSSVSLVVSQVVHEAYLKGLADDAQSGNNVLQVQFSPPAVTASIRATSFRAGEGVMPGSCKQTLTEQTCVVPASIYYHGV